MLRSSLAKLLQNFLIKTHAKAFSAKDITRYYDYEFTNKLQFIDHTVRFPIFRAIDLEGNVLDKEFDIMDSKTATKILNVMITLREADKINLNMQRQGRITFYMTALYEEAIGPCVGAGIKDQDQLILQNREHGITMWRGISARDIMHNMKGSNKDIARGKCLSCHYAIPKIGILPKSGPMGSKIGHAAGLGYVFKHRKEDKIAVCFFGEGAASEGDIHAGMNFASTLGSQLLLFCRNNCYAISTPLEDQYAGDGIAPRGIGYNIPALKVDGCDPLAIYYATIQARKMIMETKRPVLLESYSYRGGDHSTADSSSLYITKEVKERLKNFVDGIGDPIVRMAKYMEKKGFIDNAKEEVENLSTKIMNECKQYALEIASTPFPDYRTMFEDIYKESPWNIEEQKKGLENHLKKHSKDYPLDNFKN